MKNLLIVIVLIALAAAAWFFWLRPVEEPPAPVPVIERPPAVAPAPAPAPALPVDEPSEPVDYGAEVEPPPPEPQRAPLPALEDSDGAVLETASAITAADGGLGLLVRDNVLPRIVATVDALTSRQVPGQLLPLEPPVVPFQANVEIEPPTTATNAQGDVLEQYTFDPINYDRYAPYVELLESFDAEQFAAEYLHYAPRLQQAYVDLGYPEGDFHARLLEVMDHLLATPEPAGTVYLVKPEAYHQFLDPDLEALSAGQKALIRMGPANAARVKSKLREFRAALGG